MSGSRRAFLKSLVGGSTLLTLSPRWPAFLTRTAAAAATDGDDTDTVLVVLQLSGGNDGLNTVVPVGDDAYGRNRHTLRLKPAELHKIDHLLGFHSALDGLARLWGEGKLTVVQGVGYANSHRGHDEAMRDWHTARPGDSSCQTGWMGRALDAADCPQAADLPGVFVGSIPQPLGITGRRFTAPSLRTPEQLCLTGTAPGGNRADPPPAGGEPRADENPLADYVCRADGAARAGSQRLQQVLRSAPFRGDYPDCLLGAQLRSVAQLIQAELGIRLFFTELGGGGIGGFDNHANQRDNHAALLRQLSQAVTAFVDDLDQAGLLHRVVLMSFSEFGRTLGENGRRGTDHGAAQPLLLAGARLCGGLLGAHPSLAELEQDAPKPHTDFRRVYASLLDGWLGLDSQTVLGDRFESLKMFR